MKENEPPTVEAPETPTNPACPVPYGEPPLLRRSQHHDYTPSPHPDPDAILPIHERLATDDRFTGLGVTAAFLDSGFYAHADLMKPAPRIKGYHDLVNGRSGLHWIEEGDISSWHGMMTSSVAAGNGFLSGGRFKALAPRMELVLLKVGHLARVKHADIQRGIEWVIAHKDLHKIRVLNISCGGDHDISYVEDPLCRAAEDAVRAGIVVVCAVGNAGMDPQHRVLPPASAPAVITVGGLNDHGDPRHGKVKSYFSSYGPTIDGLQKPEVIAPAIWVVAPILPGTPTHDEAEFLTQLAQAEDRELAPMLAAKPGMLEELDGLRDEKPYLLRQAIDALVRDAKVISGDYKHVDGSSFAAPIVTSIVAQMLEANPALTPQRVKRILIDTARRVPGIPVERQGWGVVQPAAAIAEAERRKKR